MTNFDGRPVRIRVQGVGKMFTLRASGGRTLKSAVIGMLRRGGGSRDFWAVRDVSFEVREGETLGIIGGNGAGKSTLLALLAGTKNPTTGSIVTTGTISSLLELGAGFHPELSGRENVFLAGAVMGLSRKTMRDRMDAIVEFAGLEKFIDQPVKHYSSGMYVRLGFAVAVEVDPDILLIDEVLAVGDSIFQSRCLHKMEEFRARKKTMVMISHDLPTVASISDRILLMDEGKVAAIGLPDELIRTYETMTRDRRLKSMEREWGTGEARITGVEFVDAEGRPAQKVLTGQPLHVRLGYEAKKGIRSPVFGFSISTEHGVHVYGNNTQIESYDIPELAGKGTVTLVFPKLNLGRGTFLFSFSVHSSDHMTNYHRIEHKIHLDVSSAARFEGCCYLPVEWRHEGRGS